MSGICTVALFSVVLKIDTCGLKMSVVFDAKFHYTSSPIFCKAINISYVALYDRQAEFVLKLLNSIRNDLYRYERSFT